MLLFICSKIIYLENDQYCVNLNTNCKSIIIFYIYIFFLRFRTIPYIKTFKFSLYYDSCFGFMLQWLRYLASLLYPVFLYILWYQTVSHCLNPWYTHIIFPFLPWYHLFPSIPLFTSLAYHSLSLQHSTFPF